MVFKFIERSLRGTNLEVFKFALYLSFPIGYMYYFGTNLEERFAVPGFWPTQEQSHKIPFERDEIKAEIERHQRMKKLRMEQESANAAALAAFARERNNKPQEDRGETQKEGVAG